MIAMNGQIIVRKTSALRVKPNSRTTLSVLAVLFIVLVICLEAVSLQHSYDVGAKKDETRAVSLGVTKATTECLKVGLGKPCGNLTVSVDESEYNGKTCWIVYADTSDKSLYGSSMIIQYVGKNMKVINYLRSTR